MSHDRKWHDWLARIGYGVEWGGDQAEPPPCTLTDLAAAYVRVVDVDGDSVEDWARLIITETGALGGDA